VIFARPGEALALAERLGVRQGVEDRRRSRFGHLATRAGMAASGMLNRRELFEVLAHRQSD